jgi:hypothetical protein
MTRRPAAEDDSPFEPTPYKAPPVSEAERLAAEQLWQDYQACIERVLRERANRSSLASSEEVKEDLRANG